jgi:hypothetical protein
MKNLKFSALTVLAIACGGEAAGEYPDYFPSDAGAELGTAEQPLTSQIAGSGTAQRITGVIHEQQPLNGLTLSAFNSLDNSLTWFVPPFKTWSIKVLRGACSDVQWNRFNPRASEAIIELNDALKNNGWSITRNVNGKHTLQCLDLPNSPLGVDSIRNFVRVQCSQDFANLVDDQGLPGVATRYDTCTVAVDSAQILGYGFSTSNENRMYRHAILHGLEKLVGVGEEQGTNGTVSQGTAQQTVTLGLFTSGQLCRTKFYTIGSATVYGTSTSQGCANN